MSLNWGENTFCKLYPLIKDLYNQESVGSRIKEQLQNHFVPSFFSQNLCEKTNLMGRVSAKLFLVCKRLHLDGFTCFSQDRKLLSIVLKAERCWLARLLNDYDNIQHKPQNEQEIKFIAQHFKNVVTQKDEVISKKEVQQRLNQLVALTNAFYEIHGKSHTDVTSRGTRSYFNSIFGDT